MRADAPAYDLRRALACLRLYRFQGRSVTLGASGAFFNWLSVMCILGVAGVLRSDS